MAKHQESCLYLFYKKSQIILLYLIHSKKIKNIYQNNRDKNTHINLFNCKNKIKTNNFTQKKPKEIKKSAKNTQNTTAIKNFAKKTTTNHCLLLDFCHLNKLQQQN